MSDRQRVARRRSCFSNASTTTGCQGPWSCFCRERIGSEFLLFIFSFLFSNRTDDDVMKSNYNTTACSTGERIASSRACTRAYVLLVGRRWNIILSSLCPAVCVRTRIDSVVCYYYHYACTMDESTRKDLPEKISPPRSHPERSILPYSLHHVHHEIVIVMILCSSHRPSSTRRSFVIEIIIS
jgi:hypothetical protein